MSAPEVPAVVEETLPEEILRSSPEEIMTRVRLIDNDLKVSCLCPLAKEEGGGRPYAPSMVAAAGGMHVGCYCGGSELTHFVPCCCSSLQQTAAYR